MLAWTAVTGRLSHDMSMKSISVHQNCVAQTWFFKLNRWHWSRPYYRFCGNIDATRNHVASSALYTHPVQNTRYRDYLIRTRATKATAATSSKGVDRLLLPRITYNCEPNLWAPTKYDHFWPIHTYFVKAIESNPVLIHKDLSSLRHVEESVETTFDELWKFDRLKRNL
jgi:hypothetical protein